MEWGDLSEAELMDWLERGTVFTKFTHGRLATDARHSCRLWVCDDQLRCSHGHTSILQYT